MADYDAQPGRPTPPDAERSPAQLEADDVDLHTGLGAVAGAWPVLAAWWICSELSRSSRCTLSLVSRARASQLIEPCGSAPRIQVWAGTADFVRQIDTVQYEELKEGPCMTCMESRRPTVSGSLGSDDRWPHFGGRVARLGVHSALSLPLIVDDQVVGAHQCVCPQPRCLRRARGDTGFSVRRARRGVGVQRPAAVEGSGSGRATSPRTGQPDDDRSSDRHSAQPVWRERGGGLRPAHQDQPEGERQVAGCRRADCRGGRPARACKARGVVSRLLR